MRLLSHLWRRLLCFEPFSHKATKSRLGSKSQGVGCTLLFFRFVIIIFIHFWIPIAQADADARVDADSPPASGALRGELLGGSTARATTFSAPNSGRQRIRKRAYARALRRASLSQDGTAT